MTQFSGRAKIAALTVCGLALLTVVAGAGGAPNGQQLSPLLKRSQAVAINYWSQYPDQAPQALRGGFQRLQDASTAATEGPAPLALISQVRFNKDTQGLPQNEESVAVCRTNPNLVLGGTNDYRGLVSATGDFTGYHFSNTGGSSVVKEGQLPGFNISGIFTPSGGDPVSAFDPSCNGYAASINYTFFSDGSTKTSAIVLYKSTNLNTSSCTSPATCWPVAGRKIIDSTTVPSSFLDKEWMDVGVSGGAGTVVWVTWTEFSGLSSRIKAARCDATTLVCGAPITVSDPGDSDFGTGNKFTQFSYVEIGQSGRVYISYVSVAINPSTDAQTFTIKLKSINPGTTTLKPAVTVATLTKPIPFGGFLHAEDFRVATVPKLAVRKMDSTHDRVLVVYDQCTYLLFTNICEEPKVSLRSATVTNPASTSPSVGAFSELTMSLSGDNYFPTVSNDRSGTSVAVAYYTNRFDTFHHRYDVELVTYNPAVNTISNRQRETSGVGSNEPDADPYLGGFFIGDYLQVFAQNNTAYTHFNANYTQLKLLELGLPVNQQDNYLNKSGL